MIPRGPKLYLDDPPRSNSRRRWTFLPGDHSLPPPSVPSYSLATRRQLLYIPLGVPFSWEKLPGEPKEFPHHRKTESANNLLPLPPHRNNYSHNTRRKKNTSPAAMIDPFTAALVECSKGTTADGEYTGSESKKVSRKISIGLVNLYASCRRACAVSESIVYIPRSIDGVASYDHLLLSTRRRRRWFITFVVILSI